MFLFQADPKWKVRKEALEVVAPLAAKPKLAPGDYGELVAAMKKVILYGYIDFQPVCTMYVRMYTVCG